MPEKFTPTPDGLPEPRFGISNSLDPIHYEPRTEALVFIWNDSATTATVPDLRLDPHPKDGAVKIVRVNGRSMTEIHGDPQLQADDIFLLPLSAAERVGLVHR